jgi:hypothetical protein
MCLSGLISAGINGMGNCILFCQELSVVAVPRLSYPFTVVGGLEGGVFYSCLLIEQRAMIVLGSG